METLSSSSSDLLTSRSTESMEVDSPRPDTPELSVSRHFPLPTSIPCVQSIVFALILSFCNLHLSHHSFNHHICHFPTFLFWLFLFIPPSRSLSSTLSSWGIAAPFMHSNPCMYASSIVSPMVCIQYSTRLHRLCYTFSSSFNPESVILGLTLSLKMHYLSTPHLSRLPIFPILLGCLCRYWPDVTLRYLFMLPHLFILVVPVQFKFRISDEAILLKMIDRSSSRNSPLRTTQDNSLGDLSPNVSQLYYRYIYQQIQRAFNWTRQFNTT